MLQPGISCGRCAACLSGKDNECARFEVLGHMNTEGGYAEFIKVPAQAFPLTFLTAWHMGGEIDRLTNRRGVDVVMEHVGEATWAQSVASLARGGRLVTCGATTGVHAAIDLRTLFTRQLTISGSYLGSKGELMRAARFFFAGQLDPVIDRTFALSEAAAAHRHLEEGKPFGKVVLEV